MRLLSLFMVIISFSALNAGDFEDYFIDKTMRIDYYHIGDARSQFYTVDRVHVYGSWAGNPDNLIDNFNNGSYYVKIYDPESEGLIFSKGFDTYFGEYRTTEDAIRGIRHTFHESALIPCPKDKISLVIETRDSLNKLYKIFETEIDPADVSILRKEPNMTDVEIIDAHISGDIHKKVDIVIAGDAYTSAEKEKFLSDLKRFTKIILDMEPYKSNKDKINIRGVFRASAESGPDEPRSGIYRNNILGTTFNSLGLARYVLTENNRMLRDICAHAPYDAIYVMVNSTRYGGGGIYNTFAIFTSDNERSPYVFVHEFGHSFAGLADEYYSSAVPYSDFYPPGVEPTEPNITALLDPANLKWKEFVEPGTEIPTPWKKKVYDAMNTNWQKKRQELNRKISDLKTTKASDKELDRAKRNLEKETGYFKDRQAFFLKQSPWWGKVGAFEGAGYASEGLYRPMLDCIMFSSGMKPFCKVCEAAVMRMIRFYSD